MTSECGFDTLRTASSFLAFSFLGQIWSSLCESCKIREPRLHKMQNRYKGVRDLPEWSHFNLRCSDTGQQASSTRDLMQNHFLLMQTYDHNFLTFVTIVVNWGSWGKNTVLFCNKRGREEKERKKEEGGLSLSLLSVGGGFVNKSLKCANYKSVLRVQHPAPQDWVWISHDDGDDDDYGGDDDHSARNGSLG